MILKNITYIDPSSFEFIKTNLRVDKGVNNKIQFLDTINSETEEIIDCEGLFATKSFVVGHHHAYSALATGMPSPTVNPKNFHEILQYVWWNLDKKLDADSIRASALVTAMNSALNGSTFIIDHHASPFAIENSLDIIAKAFEEVGVSHLLCYEISDRDGYDIAQKGIDETEKYLAKNQGLVGLHASFTVGENTFKKAVELVNKYDSGIHIHVAEDQIDQQITLEKYNCRVIERLDNYDLLKNKKSILSHCLHLNINERQLLSKSNSYVVQNTESNLNNRVGVFSRKFLNPDNLMIGTDGMHSNMMAAANATYFTTKLFDNTPLPDIYKQLRNNHLYIKNNGFKGDGDNNLIVFDYNYSTEFNQNNFLGHFFYSMSAGIIKHVISNGEFIVKDKKLFKTNETEILKFAREQAKRLWSLL